jgi:high-affinity K+ transport system ATPase subunit B
MTKHKRKDFSLFDRALAAQAVGSAVAKLDPRVLSRNPVMFVTAVVALLTTLLFVRDVAIGASTTRIVGQIAVWLWVTVLFATSPRPSPRAAARRAPTASGPRSRKRSASACAAVRAPKTTSKPYRAGLCERTIWSS